MSWKTSFARHLLRNRTPSASVSVTAILGIAFGVCTLLTTLSVMTGFDQSYQKAILGFNAHVVAISEDELYGLEKPDAFADSEITGSTPFLFREGLGLLPDGVASIVLKGINPIDATRVYTLSYHFLDAHSSLNSVFVNDDSLPSVLIGKQLFEKFFPEGLKGEGTVTLLIPQENSGIVSSAKIKDFSKKFKVAGTFESGLYEFDSKFILTSLTSMQAVFHLGDRITGFEASLKNPETAYAFARNLEKKLPPSFQVISWDELNGPLFSAMKMEKTLFLVILLIVILVASFNVVALIVMLMWERQMEIALLSSLGARFRELAAIFSWQGIWLSLGGLILGTLLSVGLLWSLQTYDWIPVDPQVYFITKIPVVWPMKLWTLLIAASLIICVATARLSTRLILKRGKIQQVFR